MASHNDLGKHGEDIAAEYLIALGHKIHVRNWVCGKAEIDIISQIDNTLCVIEVKTRSSVTFGLPQDFVTPKKIRLLTNAVNEFIRSRRLECEVRFDIMAVTRIGQRYDIEYLTDAFYYF